MWQAIPLSLVLLLTIGVFRRRKDHAATAGILLVNWTLCTGVVALCHDPYPVLFFIVADYLSALSIFCLRSSRWQSVIMGVYGIQLICHGAYALSGMGVGPTYYSYWALTYLAWVQVALIGGWIGTDLVGRWLPFFGSRHFQARADAYYARQEDAR